LAKGFTCGEINPWKSGTKLFGTFGRDRHTRQTAKTQRKVPRLGEGKKRHKKTRYPTVKKTVTRQKKETKEAA
jgi:hypothetical protein